MNRAMRNIHLQHAPIGESDRGAPYGERLDPVTLDSGAMSNGGGWLSLAGTALNVGGNLMAAGNAGEQGQAKGQALDYEATLLNQNALAAQASSQREAMDVRLKTSLLVSRAIAVAAAGGGSASDPTVNKVVGDLTGIGAYHQAVALYGGDDRARAMRAAAAGKRYEAGMARSGGDTLGEAYTIKALGSGIAGASTLFAKYGKGGPGMNSMGVAGAGDGGWADGWEAP